MSNSISNPGHEYRYAGKGASRFRYADAAPDVSACVDNRTIADMGGEQSRYRGCNSPPMYSHHPHNVYRLLHSAAKPDARHDLVRYVSWYIRRDRISIG